jgi:hypothetical protein
MAACIVAISPTIFVAQPSALKGTPVPAHATGPFDGKLTPQHAKVDFTLGRMTLGKTFQGDLEATSKGQMLTASTDVKGSAGYAAIERVTGTLHTSVGSRTGNICPASTAAQ